MGRVAEIAAVDAADRKGEVDEEVKEYRRSTVSFQGRTEVCRARESAAPLAVTRRNVSFPTQHHVDPKSRNDPTLAGQFEN